MKEGIKEVIHKSYWSRLVFKQILKILLDYFIHWNLRNLKDCISKDTLTDSSLEGVITCILKSGKHRNGLKNRRRFTLVNLIHTFFHHADK